MNQIALENDIAIMRALWHLAKGGTSDIVAEYLDVRITASIAALTESIKHQYDARPLPTVMPKPIVVTKVIEVAGPAGNPTQPRPEQAKFPQ